jgi:TatD DNase family protein
MILIDSHSHIDVDTFDADRDAVLARARAAGVTRQIVPAVMCETFATLRDLCAREAGLFPAYGLHPTFLQHHHAEHLLALAHWLERERPVAVGECGLDYFVEGLDHAQQQTYLERQLELAREFELPVILHGRRAFDPLAATLRRIGNTRGVVHSFGGSLQQAEAFWKLGFCIGIGGPITYPRAHRLRSIVAEMPLDFLLLETDAPDQPLCGHQGQRNEPERLRDVCATIAELRGVDAATIAAATTANAVRLFRLPVWESGMENRES